jgi:hypothetical protein
MLGDKCLDLHESLRNYLADPLACYRGIEFATDGCAALTVHSNRYKHSSFYARENAGGVDSFFRKRQLPERVDVLQAAKVLGLGAARGGELVVKRCGLSLLTAKLCRGIQGAVATFCLSSPHGIDRLIPSDDHCVGQERALALEVLVCHGTPGLVDDVPRIDSRDHFVPGPPNTQDRDTHEAPNPFVLSVIHPIGQAGVRWLTIHVAYLSQNRRNRKWPAGQALGTGAEAGHQGVRRRGARPAARHEPSCPRHVEYLDRVDVAN